MPDVKLTGFENDVLIVLWNQRRMSGLTRGTIGKSLTKMGHQFTPRRLAMALDTLVKNGYARKSGQRYWVGDRAR